MGGKVILRVTVLSETTINPITKMGERAGICWGADISDPEKNYKRGMDCLESNHGRVFEFADVVMELDGYSARVIRELYTAMIGVSKLQASTRYIDYSNEFDYYTPSDLENNVTYHKTMFDIQRSYQKLIDEGYKKEDLGNLLPLGLNSKMVLKIDMRAILHLAEIRMCSRAYIEFQDLMKDMQLALSQLDGEWLEIAKLMKPKCENCTEKENCEW